MERDPGARRYLVRFACSAQRPSAWAGYVVYDTDSTSSHPRKLTSGGFPCDGTEYANSIGKLRSGVQIAFTTLPSGVVAGYAIVVPEEEVSSSGRS